MVMVVLASASGSPGVTTSGLGLALTWPRPVLLVEADPTGGSAVLAGYFRGAAPHTTGLVDLACAHRDGSLAAALPGLTMQVPGSSVSLLAGVRAHGQSRSMTGVWDALAVALWGLDGSGQDVIVDAGRLGLEGCPEPLVYGADLMLLVIRTDLVALSAARSWADTLREGFVAGGAAGRLGALLVGEGRPYRSREVGKLLQMPVTASLAWEPDAAAVFAHGAAPRRRFDTSPLPRSLRAARLAIGSAIDADRASLAVNQLAVRSS